MKAVGLLMAVMLAACGASADADSSANASQSNVHPAGSFPLSHKGWSATLLSVEGENSRAAAITGRVLEGDAREYCERDPGGITTEFGGRLTLEQCVQETVREEGETLFTASADCINKAIASTNGRYELVGFDNEYFEPQWRSVADGEILDGSGASGAATVTAQFAALCPAVARAWRSREQ